MCVCTCSATLAVNDSFETPWTGACQAPLCTAFSRQEYWSGLPWEFPDSGIEPESLESPAFAGGFFTTIAAWEAPEGK